MKQKIWVLFIILVLSTSTVFAAVKFKDVKPNQWFTPYVLKAASLGIIDGYADGSFRPNELVTRAQLAKVMVNYDKKVNQSLLEIVQKSEIEERQIINMVAKTIPSTVRVEGPAGVGSGFFIRASTIITNAHVVEGGSVFTITLSTGEKLQGTILKRDTIRDLALIEVPGYYTSLPLTTTISVGQTALAIGNPNSFTTSVTKGIISRTNVFESFPQIYFQLDTPINPGNSGGAIINLKGEVLGIAVSKISREGVEGLAFGIHSFEIKKFLTENGY